LVVSFWHSDCHLNNIIIELLKIALKVFVEARSGDWILQTWWIALKIRILLPHFVYLYNLSRLYLLYWTVTQLILSRTVWAWICSEKQDFLFLIFNIAASISVRQILFLNHNMLLKIFLFIIILNLKHINFFYTLINIILWVIADKLVLLKIFYGFFNNLPLYIRLTLINFSRESLIQRKSLYALSWICYDLTWIIDS
jgi:hypothetical protein